jgi:hypothetical protein
VTRETEDATERDRRRYQRELFDGVARLYAATRPGYPPELAGFVAATAGAGPGAAVLEVGLTLAAEVTMARVRRPACGG